MLQVFRVVSVSGCSGCILKAALQCFGLEFQRVAPGSLMHRTGLVRAPAAKTSYHNLGQAIRPKRSLVVPSFGS